jgi:hypothetical protein
MGGHLTLPRATRWRRSASAGFAAVLAVLAGFVPVALASAEAMEPLAPRSVVVHYDQQAARPSRPRRRRAKPRSLLQQARTVARLRISRSLRLRGLVVPRTTVLQL